MYYPPPLYSSPISIFYFTSLRFYSIFASPFYYCYNILDGFYPPPVFLSFRLCIFFYCTLSDIFLPISVSPPFNFPLLCLSIAYAYNLSFLILQSHHFILSLLFSKYFFLTTIPDEGISPKRRIIKIFSLNLHISHLDH